MFGNIFGSAEYVPQSTGPLFDIDNTTDYIDSHNIAHVNSVQLELVSGLMTPDEKYEKKIKYHSRNVEKT